MNKDNEITDKSTAWDNLCSVLGSIPMSENDYARVLIAATDMAASARQEMTEYHHSLIVGGWNGISHLKPVNACHRSQAPAQQ